VVDNGGTANGGQNTDQSPNTITINVTPVNDAPVAVVDTTNVVESGNTLGVLQNNAVDNFVGTPSATGNVLANDTDVDVGDTKTLTLVNGVSITVTDTVVAGTYGNLTIKADGTFTYNIDNTKAVTQALTQGQVVHDVFNYTMKDTAGLTSSSNLDVAVTGTNDRPIIDLNPSVPSAEGDYVVSFTENGSPISIAATNMAITDVDDTFMESATVNLTNAFAGDVLAIGTLPGTITFSRVGNVITLTGHALLSDYATAIKAITFVNTSDNPLGGVGNERYIAVTVNDGQAEAITANAVITVNPVNDAPVAVGSTNTGLEDATSITVQLQGTDVDGTVASFVLTSLPPNGALYTDAAMTILAITGVNYTATGNALNFYFKPAANWNGSTSLNFNAVDNNGAVSVLPATEIIVVTPVNDGPPVAVNDAFSTLVGSPITFTRDQLVANDSLVDFATITGTGALPAGLTYNAATQTYTYNPVATGNTSFTYTLTDQDGQTSSATVNLSAFNARDDLATVNESALAGGTGGGVSVAAGNLFTNDTTYSGAITNIVAGANTTILSNTAVGTVHTITTNYGVLVVDYATVNNGAYTYTLKHNVDNDTQAGATSTQFAEAFTYTRTGGTASLVVTIKDDVPVAENSTTEVAASALPAYNLCLMLDVSGSMTIAGASGDQRLVDANGNATIVSAAGANLGTSTLAQSKAAMKALVSKFFDESSSVSVHLGIFSTAAQTDGIAYTTKASALAAIDALANLTGGTNYSAGLTTLQSMFGTIANPNDGVSRISYFITDGTPGAGDLVDPAGSTGFRTFANTNHIQSYALGIGPAVDTTQLAPLNGIHNVDSDKSNIAAGAVNNGKDAAIIVTDLNSLTSVLTATVPQSFGGNVAGAGSSVNFGADGGHVQYIDVVLGAGAGTHVVFTYNTATGQITNNNNAIAGGTVTGSSLSLTSVQGFTKGNLVFDFITGDYTYYPQGTAVEGDQFGIGFGVIDNDGNTASAVNTIRFVDGKPQAFDDFDTFTPSAAAAATKFFEGNVINAVGTDGGGAQLTGFRTGASGEDNTVNGADVTSIVFKGTTYNLTAVSSGTANGGTYTINAGGELKWTSSTDATNVLVFHRDGYYQYAPPAAQTGTPPQAAASTVSFATSGAAATAAGITLGGYTRTANLNNAPDATVTFNASGAGVNGGSGNNTVDNLENFSIVFDRATHPQGVQNVTININAGASLLGNNGSGGIGALQYSIFDIAGNLIGQFASAAENVITIPPQFSNIGKILIQPNSSTTAGTGSVAGVAEIQSVTFNNVLVAATAVIPDEVIQYTITDKDTLTAPDSSTANLTLHVVTNEYVGTAAVDTVNGSAGNDLISGLAGNDILNGLAGNDIIRGGAGDDTIDGGADNDQLYGGDGNDTILGGTGDDYLYGEAGNDNLQGGDGNDKIYGGVGNDIINGGNGNDLIVGGPGNDILTGGAGADVFKWELADKGIKGAPAADTITDFDMAPVASGGDALDLRDLLVSENHVTGAGNLASYLHFEKVGADTIIHVSSNGEYAAGFSAAKDVQTITLTNVDLVTGFANDQQIIIDLLAKQKLITD
jgi:VCBS repeat-containing protein